jgi:anti-sigma regulatory factor (Ser/Thr protein kinase)
MIGTESNAVFHLRNGPDTAGVCAGELRAWIDRFAADCCAFSEARRGQVWIVVWEAVQNAIRHGSSADDEVLIRLRSVGNPSWLAVELTQPRDWRNWANQLGDARKAEVRTGRFLLGGTVVMLWFTDRIEVNDDGRRIALWFASEVKERRRVTPPVFSH